MDKKIERIMQITIIAMIVIPAVSSAQLQLSPTLSTYKNEAHGFRIDYPGDWVKEYYPADAMVAFLEPHGYASVGVKAYSTPGMNLDEIIESFRDISSQGSIYYEGYITVNSLKGYEWHYISGYSVQRLIVFAYNSKTYIIACSSKWNYYDNYAKVLFDDMVESFEIVSKTPTPMLTPTPTAPIQTPTHTPTITSTPHHTKITPPPTVTQTPRDNILYNPYVLGAVISAVIIAISSIIGAWISSRRRL